jgi:hypothetical protein
MIGRWVDHFLLVVIALAAVLLAGAVLAHLLNM